MLVGKLGVVAVVVVVVIVVVVVVVVVIVVVVVVVVVVVFLCLFLFHGVMLAGRLAVRLSRTSRVSSTRKTA